MNETDPFRGDTPRDDAPSPFDRPSLEPERSGGPGVGKPLLVGCGVLMLLVLVAGILFVAYQNEIAAWLFETMETQLQPLVPEDLPPEVRQRYETAFDGAVAAIRTGEYNPLAMQEVQQEFMRVAKESSGENARMSPEDVERLAAALEKVPAGGGGSDDEGGGDASSDPPRAETV